MTSLLSLLEGCDFSVGRMDVHIWSPNPSQGFSCNSLFNLLDPPQLGSLFFMVWRIKNLKKVRFFIWFVLLSCVNTMDIFARKKSSFVGPFCCILSGRWRKTCIIFFGIASSCGLCGVLFCRSLMLASLVKEVFVC